MQILMLKCMIIYKILKQLRSILTQVARQVLFLLFFIVFKREMVALDRYSIFASGKHLLTLSLESDLFHFIFPEPR